MPAGQPSKYKSAEELEQACNNYFEFCEAEEDGIFTVPGLAIYLGYACRQSIQDLKENDKFSYTIKKALARIEQQRLKMCLKGETNPAISIFDLKNNFGYKDKQELEHSGKDGGPIEFSDIERSKRIAAILERGRQAKSGQSDSE